MGAGRSGTVYKARHVMLDQYRAIKQIPARQENREEPEREARILKGLKHPGIPIIYDVFRTKESYFLVEEFLEGESLFALVSRRGSLSKAETVSYGIQLCRIISYLHHSADNPILHLDLQPKNILLCQDVLKLIDFDQAVFKSCGRRAARRCGTAGCAAPEQYTDEPLDEQTDIYAIGALLFYMRKGMFPNAGACPDGKAGGLTAVIGKCLCEKKEERYDSVSTLLRELISLEEESFSKQNLSSLTIAFAGSKPGIGVTHVSLGLAVFLTDRGIPVLLKNSMAPDAPGTVISDAEVGGHVYRAVAAKDGITAVRIYSARMLMAYGFLRRVFEVFEKYRTPIDMITTSEVAVSLTVDSDCRLPEIIAELSELGTVEVDTGNSIVCIVGRLDHAEHGRAREIMEAAGDVPLKMISYGASHRSIALLTDTRNRTRLLRNLNDKLFGKDAE